MPVKVECYGENCEEDILEETGFQLIEGEVVIDHGSEIVEQEEYHGVFCSLECLSEYINRLSTEGESE